MVKSRDERVLEGLVMEHSPSHVRTRTAALLSQSSPETLFSSPLRKVAGRGEVQASRNGRHIADKTLKFSAEQKEMLRRESEVANEPKIRNRPKQPLFDLVQILASTCSQLLWSLSDMRVSNAQVEAAFARFDKLTRNLVVPNQMRGLALTPLDHRIRNADHLYWRILRKPVYSWLGFVEEDFYDFQRKFSGPLSLTIDLSDFEDGGSAATAQSLSALHNASMLSINDHSRDGSTALMLAAQYNRVGVLEALIGAGGNPQACDSTGNTALHIASGLCHVGAIKVLLKAGCDPFVQNRCVLLSIYIGKHRKSN